MKRAIKFNPEHNFYTIRGWDGKENNRTESDILSATMSDDTRQTMTAMLQEAKDKPGQWITYPND